MSPHTHTQSAKNPLACSGRSISHSRFVLRLSGSGLFNHPKPNQIQPTQTSRTNPTKQKTSRNETPPSKGTGENITVGSDTWDWTPSWVFCCHHREKSGGISCVFQISMTWKIYYVNCVWVSYFLIPIFLLFFVATYFFCPANHAHMC